MSKFYSHKANCPSLSKTSTSFHPVYNNYPPPLLALQQTSAYNSSMNYHLLNSITDAQTQKNYYRTKLTQQFHNHHNQLEDAFANISEKNQFIVQLEEQLDRMSKDYRVLSDQYVGLKQELEGEKEKHTVEIRVLKNNHEVEIKKIQDESAIRIQKQINLRVQEVESQCQSRVQMFKHQLQQARQYSTQISHQLKLLQNDYHQVMLKNDTIIQQSIHRQLRKRDFQAQNNYLRDVAQYQTLKKNNLQLKTQIAQNQKNIQQIQQENKRLKAKNIVLQTKMKDLQEAFEYEKTNNRVKLVEKYKETEQMQTNTEQGYVPVIMPVETNLVGEIIALKQFLSEKMIMKYEQFFTKASLKQKKKSASLITFKNFLGEQLKNAQQNSLLMHIHTGLQRIVKLYCPAMSYSRQFLTVKDQFIRKTLMQCQGLNNKQQKLFRLLQLVHRLHHPITHVKSQISTGQLKMVELKVMTTLKKIFSSV